MITTCPDCGDELIIVRDGTILRHPQYTAGQIDNKGMIWCDQCCFRQVIDPWALDNSCCAIIQQMVEPPFVEWQANTHMVPIDVREEMHQRIEQDGDWQAPLGWKRLSCLSFLSSQTTETEKLHNHRFHLNTLDNAVSNVTLDEFSGCYLLRCLSPVSGEEFDYIFHNIFGDHK